MYILRKLQMELYRYGLDLAANRKHLRWIAPALIAADAVLCGLIIWRIPYTEIDWQAYMEQVSQFIEGERDYTLIKGGTGPLVYPAAHVFIYTALYHLTNKGTNILLAQVIFALIYLITLALVMVCYRLAKAPPYIFPLLVLSKRLHSVYILRLFNDCFAILALWLTVFAYQKRVWTIGSISYSFGVGVKMSVLLALPAVGVILAQAMGAGRAIRQAFLMAQIQTLIAVPFLPVNALGYLSRAFEFTRQFLFKWTVNWRFVGEETFLSKQFTISLLLAHLTVLFIFLSTRWIRPSGQSLKDFVHLVLQPPGLNTQQEITARASQKSILTAILTANTIGMLFARSLHYQFYAWTAWGTPFLLWRTGFHPIVQYALWLAQEWAWNVYPSTNASSLVVVGVMAVTVFGVWWGTRNDLVEEDGSEAPARSKEHTE